MGFYIQCFMVSQRPRKAVSMKKKGGSTGKKKDSATTKSVVKSGFVGFQVTPDEKAWLEGRAIAAGGISLGELLRRLVAAAATDDRSFWDMVANQNADEIRAEADRAQFVLQVMGLEKLFGDRRPPAREILRLQRQVTEKKLSVDDFKRILQGWKAYYDVPFGWPTGKNEEKK